MSQYQPTLDTSQYHSQSSNRVTRHTARVSSSWVTLVNSGGGAGGILQFSDFFGCPVGQGLGLTGPAPPAGGQELGDWLHVQEGHDVAPEGGTEIADEAGASCDTCVAVLAIPGHHCDELDDVRDVRLDNCQVGRGGVSVTLQA